MKRDRAGAETLDVDRFEALLRARLAELERRVRTIETALDEPAAADFEERATEREGDEVLEDLGSAGLAEMGMIRAALRRIDEGTYGTCVNCGEPIAPARLEAVPHAARCIACA